MKNYTKIIAAVAAGLTCTAATSRATLTSIAQPATGANSISTLPTAAPTGTGSALKDTGPVGYAFGPGDSGTIESLVFATDTESGALSGYLFEFIVSVTTGDLTSAGFQNFFGSSIAVGVTGGTTPSSIGYSSLGTINVDWSSDINPGESETIYVSTGITGYGPSYVSLNDTGSGSGYSLAPVPEPTTIAAGALMLLPFGIGAMRSLRKDRIA